MKFQENPLPFIDSIVNSSMGKWDQKNSQVSSVPDADIIITKLDLDDGPLDDDPGCLNILPAERIGHLLPPGIEYFLKGFRGELEMPGI
jgi:hypothetical protein